MGKPLLMTMLNVDVYCGRAVTKEDTKTIQALIARTQKKLNQPYYGHTLHLCGDFASSFLTNVSGVSLNVSRVKAKLCNLGIVIGSAPPSFYAKRKQVLDCPNK
ncbi:hypothetical protein fHeYen902_010c [Yersinia phage fHe-Yen9-02]|nr:hypothetical protein fHeYen902_010c [Yersinia phage fHe-Yen9-02]